MTLTLAIVVVFTEAVLVARGSFVGALALAALAMPALVLATRRSHRR